MKALGDALPLSKKFWTWFGKSVVRNQNGSPKVAYHGTRSPLDYYAFETGSLFDEEGNLLISSSGDPGSFIGPHFTGDRDLASKFASGKGADWDNKRFITNEFPEDPAIQLAYGRVIPVYLRIINPIYFEDDTALINFIWANGESNAIDAMLEGEYELNEDGLWVTYDGQELDQEDMATIIEKTFYRLSEDSYEGGQSNREEGAQELGESIRSKLEHQGYDGIVYQNTIEGGGLSYCTFNSTQVKSAIANRGTWSLKDPNILH